MVEVVLVVVRVVVRSAGVGTPDGEVVAGARKKLPAPPRPECV